MFLVAIAGVAICTRRWNREGRVLGSSRLATLFISLCLFLVVVVQYSYSEGNLFLAADARLGVVLVPFIAVAATIALKELPLAYPIAALIVALNMATAGANEKGKSLLLYREYASHLDFLKSYPKGRTLVITERPGMYVVHLYGAVDFNYANNNYDDLTQGKARHLYKDILAIQFVHYKDKKVTPALDSRYQLQTLYEYQNSAEYYVRISKVN